MNSTQITMEQAARMKELIEPAVFHLRAWLDRMRETRFPPDDPLQREVKRAFDALNEVRMRLHYMSCSGTAQVRDKPDSAVHWRPPKGQCGPGWIDRQ